MPRIIGNGLVMDASESAGRNCLTSKDSHNPQYHEFTSKNLQK